MAIHLQRSETQPSWQLILRDNFTKIEKLSDFLELSIEDRANLDISPKFTLNLPKRLASKIKKGAINDPIFLQFIPLKKENFDHAGYVLNPLQEESFIEESKLLLKYNKRALIVSTSACAMHCRYCFRKNFPYETERKGFEKELSYLKEDTSIEEVILSGGDPLSLSDTALSALLSEIDDITHIKRVRFHTRFPIGIPERIDNNFLKILENSTKQIWFVIHANHPTEFDNDIFDALKRINKLGIPILHQAVLLKGVNDSIETLYELYSLLINKGVTPYYLYKLDQVEGSSHFEVPLSEGKRLVNELQKKLSGYGIPRYAQEIPGSLGKTLL